MQPLSSDWLKLQRARNHFDAFNKAVAAFSDRHPYGFQIRFVEDGNEYKGFVSIRINETLPWDIPLMVGDVCQNARSALDHLMWRLCITKNPGFRTRVYFPIYDNPDTFDRDTKRYGAFVNDRAWAAIKKAQPYETGDVSLWVLHELNRVDKHTFIPIIYSWGRPTSISVTLVDLGMPSNMADKSLEVSVRRNTPIEEGAEFAVFDASHIAPNVKVEVKADLKIALIFGDVPPAACRLNVGDFLHQALLSVEDALKKVGSTIEG
ncbi:MAG: hypothetical protein V1724_10550 [Chloroflexota bacterium]